MTISVWDEANLVHYKHYPLQTYYQVAGHKMATKDNTFLSLPLTVSFLSHTCSSLKIVIQFDNTQTNLKEKSKPKVLMEFYGLAAG